MLINSIHNRLAIPTTKLVLRETTFPTSTDGLISVYAPSVMVTYDLSTGVSTKEAAQIFCNGDTYNVVSVTATDGFQAVLETVTPGDLDVGVTISYSPSPEVLLTLTPLSVIFGVVTLTYFDGVANKTYDTMVTLKVIETQVLDLPESYVFADRLLGEEETHTFVVTNLLADTSLFIDKVAIRLAENTAPNFTCTATNIGDEILPGGTFEVSVRFVPHDTIEHYGLLVITTDRGEYPCLISGTCKKADGSFEDATLYSRTYTLPVFPLPMGASVNFTLPDVTNSPFYQVIIDGVLLSPSNSYAVKHVPLMSSIPPFSVFDLDFTYTKTTESDSGAYTLTYLLF